MSEMPAPVTPDGPVSTPPVDELHTRLKAVEDKIAGFETTLKDFADSGVGKTVARLLGIDIGALL